MPQKKKSTRTKKVAEPQEADSTYILKLVLYVIIGATWLKFENPIELGAFQFYGLPIGIMIGMLFAHHDHFQVDRKIEYAILLVVTILAFFLPIGIFI